jgi:DNA helicase-2/ATP-dependent DNA helicase PcrA
MALGDLEKALKETRRRREELMRAAAKGAVLGGATPLKKDERSSTTEKRSDAVTSGSPTTEDDDRTRTLGRTAADDLDRRRAAAAQEFAQLGDAFPELARAIASLDPDQKSACLSHARAIAVEARVGSGKTTVLVARLLVLVVRDGIDPRDIVALTFTDRAAALVRSRLDAAADRLGVSFAGVRVGTFHSIARRLLEKDLDLASVGYRPGFEILDEGGRLYCLERLAREHRLELAYKRKLAQRLEAWNENRPLIGAMKKADDFSELVRLYAQEKKTRQWMDFDDLIAIAKTLLADSAVPRPKAMLVDEFQDSDPRQFEFIEALVDRSTRLFVVGDPHQMIYSWRGTEPRIFERFRTAFSAETHSLPRNYRSTRRILDAATAMLGIANRPIESTRDLGASVRVVAEHDPLSAARYLSSRIAEWRAEGIADDDIAVLVRLKQQIPPLAEGLTRSGIRQRDGARRRFDQEPACRWTARMFELATSGGEFAEFLEWVGDRDFGFGRKKDWRLLRKSVRSKTPELIAEILEAAREHFEMDGEQRASIANLEAIVAASRRTFDADRPADRATILADWRIDRLLLPTRASYDSDRAAVEAFVDRLLETGGGIDPVASAKILAARAAALLYEECGEKRTGATEDGGIRVMTIHAAKGLEFRAVAIVGVNEGLLPIAASARSFGLEAEERRLFFVAMTRAKDHLDILWLSEPRLPRALGRPSPFLCFLPTESRVAEKTDDVRPASAGFLGVAGTISVPLAGISGSGGGRPATGRFRVGDRVRHPRYGTGDVASTTDAEVVVRFAAGTEKSFNAAFSTLSLVAE